MVFFQLLFMIFNKMKNNHCRDSFGVKPLYYFISKDQIILSSETKVFHDYCEKDEKSKILFISWLYSISNDKSKRCAFPPGCYSEIKDYKIITRTFDLKKTFKKKKSKKFESI